MILDDPATWPVDLVRLLKSERGLLLEREAARRRIQEEYDRAIQGTADRPPCPRNPHDDAYYEFESLVLKAAHPARLLGWHCTRLTEDEIGAMRQRGMRPPSLALLCERIDRLVRAGWLAAALAEKLRTMNQAGDESRAGRIWFCFFPPRRAGQSGIERFFRRWGGEALYNWHESDPVTGEILKTIGVPCVIEIDVPVAALNECNNLGRRLVQRFLMSVGWQPDEDVDHEDYATQQIDGRHIRRFVKHGEADFAHLTGCDDWNPPL